MSDLVAPDHTSPELNRRWYAVQTQPHREQRAALNLARQEFRVFLPLHRKTVRHARRFREACAPFFPRYLFVQLDIGRDRWRSVNGTYGVSQILSDGQKPRPVPAGIVEEMQAAADQLGLVRLDSRLLPGQRVRIMAGPLSGLVGELVALDENQRVKVLLDFLGKRTLVAVAAERVRLMPAA